MKYLSSFCKDDSGVSAVEFGLLALPLFLIILGTLNLGTILWKWNALQYAASVAARCVAVSGANCTSVTTGCDSGTAGVCYTETVAAQSGVPDLKAGQISLTSAATYGNTSFTTITITRPFSFLSYKMTLTASGSFPNNS